MILPVVAYGHPVLKKVAAEISRDHAGLNELIADMYETMYESEGVGLAAPQINQSIRLFVMDASPYTEKFPEVENFKRTFINPDIYQEEGVEWLFNEGCLSFPGLREDVFRKPVIHIRWFDEEWKEHDSTFEGVIGRIIQHEYDHIKGIVFVDRISSLKRMLLKGKLNDIAKGNVDVAYRMSFPMQKKRVR